MREQIIRLESHDDVITAREKLGWVQATHVLLVFPENPHERILQRRLDLVLLQREATRVQAQLALITRDPNVSESAKELGIAVFPSVEASHRRSWQMAQAEISLTRSHPPTVLDPDLVETASRLRKTQRQSVSVHLSHRTRVWLGIAGSVLFVLGALLFIPEATVHLTPAANQVTVTASIIADPNTETINSSQDTIPARIIGVEVEGSTTLDTSGTSEEPTEKARGIALFTNLIPDQITIPSGVVVRTSAAQPVRFVTLADVTLPGEVGSTAEVPIEAIEPGFSGNLPTARINQIEGPLSARLAVANSEPTRGGDVTLVSSVSPGDPARLRALLLQQLQQRAYAEMQTDPAIALNDSEFVPIESLSVVLIDSEIYDGVIGQPTPRLGLDLHVTVQAIAIDERAARQRVYERLAEKVGDGFQIAADSLVFRHAEVIDYDEQRRVTFIMQAAGDVSAAIMDDDVRRIVRGQPTTTAIDRLERDLPLASPPVIDRWPGFWPLLPQILWRIHVVIGGSP